MKKTKKDFEAEIEDLRARLEEAEETLNAIRTGEVDAFIVSGNDGQQIYTLTGADRTYRLLLESMSEGAVTLNRDGFIIYSNNFFAELLNIPRDELIGKRLLDFIPHSERQQFLSLLAQCDRGEITLRAADNDLMPVYLSVNMLSAEPEQPLTCLIVTDLREQKRDEKIIAEGKLSKLIFEQVGETIIICDDKGKIIRASDAAHRLCGQNPLHQPFDALFDLTLDQDKHFTIAHAIREQVFQSSDVSFLRKDGSTFDLVLTSVQLVGERGKILGCIVTLSDITERKLAEQALHEKNAELERFTYAVSHDLRSPLVTISTFLGHLVKDTAEENTGRVAQDLDYIHSAVKKMSASLDELLELSRIGRVVTPPVETLLQEIVQESLALVAGRIAQRGVRVTVTEKPVMLYGDRVRLVEVFQNLIDNAVKFMGEQPGPRVEIGAEIKSGETAFFVRDNGMGIDELHKDKLFGLFEKLNPDIEGMGMGLTLVKRIVEVHGGRIWVEGKVGEGATFYFTLPRKQNRNSHHGG